MTILKKIFISSDHAGFKLKEDIKLFLKKKKYSFIDLGPNNDNRVDYPDYAHSVVKKVKINKNNRGILVCGSGMGMNITANRHKNIRAAQCYNVKSTKLSRLHIPIITNPGCIMVIDNIAQHMPADGSVWITNNTKYHNAFNGGEEDRIHLVACVLDYKFN